MTPVLLSLLACLEAEDGSRCAQSWSRVRCDKNTVALEAGDRERDVHWQVPTGEPPEEGWPAVILFQGAFYPASTFWRARRAAPRGGYNQALLTAELLDSGFAVITPEAPGEGLLAWDTNLPGYKNDWEGCPDDLLMASLIEAMEAGDLGPLDMGALYAAGISSGGYMTSRMAESWPGTFRALAVHSGSWATCAGVLCQIPEDLPEDHPPTLFLHGALDATVPIWTMTDYRDALADQGVEVVSYTKILAGHAWLDEAPDEIVDWFIAN